MKHILTLILLSLSSSPAWAGDWALAGGPVREIDSTTRYQAVQVDYRPNKWLDFNAGELLGEMYLREDLHTAWYGASFVCEEQYLFASLGYVKLTRQTRNLTSPFQFEIRFGVHYEGWFLAYEHLSNADTGGANYGEDMILIGTGF